MEGHCCDYCGARLSLSKNVYTPSVKRITNEALSSYETTISWYVRTTWEGGIEILIAEKGQYSGITSQEALQKLDSYLKGTLKIDAYKNKIFPDSLYIVTIFDKFI